MATTTQQLTRYYDLYKDISVTFTKEVTGLLGLQTKFVFLKTEDRQWPCVINSSSLVGAKVIAGTKSGLLEKVQSDTAALSLRFSFDDPETKEPVAFFINSKLEGFSAYGQSGDDLALMQIQYLQRAPDFLIEKLGFFLDANVNSTRRKDDRILITPDSMRRVGLLRKETVIYVEGVPRRCILRDISFSGAKLIMVGVAQFVQDKEVVLRIDFDEPRSAIGVRGTVIRTEDVSGRKELVAIAVAFAEKDVPMVLKMHLNKYFTTQAKAATPRVPASASASLEQEE